MDPNLLPDHRRIGRAMRIFASDDLAGAGLPLWLPAGATIRSEIERYIVDAERAAGYQHVYTPQLAKQDLYERSGHWAHYRDDMYPPMRIGGDDVVLRPMNCPHHILVFNAERPGRRDLPWRVAELGTMFRNERSGAVGGLSRVRQMTLNDAHIFCLPDQIEAEVAGVLALVADAYDALGLPAPHHRLSLRGPGPKYVADDAMWARSEAVLRHVLDDAGVDYSEAPGDAAFYGPKIDLQVTDPAGRPETLSTIQVDFHLPDQFDLRVGDSVERPVMIHRSVVSTMERMVAHLLEVHDGALPLWLAPTQVQVLPIVDDVADYAHAVARTARDAGVRVRVDDRDASLGARIRDAQLAKVPYIAVIGRNEAADGTVSVRIRRGGQSGPIPAEVFVGHVADVGRRRGHDLAL